MGQSRPSPDNASLRPLFDRGLRELGRREEVVLLRAEGELMMTAASTAGGLLVTELAPPIRWVRWSSPESDEPLRRWLEETLVSLDEPLAPSGEEELRQALSFLEEALSFSLVAVATRVGDLWLRYQRAQRSGGWTLDVSWSDKDQTLSGMLAWVEALPAPYTLITAQGPPPGVHPKLSIFRRRELAPLASPEGADGARWLREQAAPLEAEILKAIQARGG